MSRVRRKVEGSSKSVHLEKLKHAFLFRLFKGLFMNPKLFKSISVPTKEKDRFLECCELLIHGQVSIMYIILNIHKYYV